MKELKRLIRTILLKILLLCVPGSLLAMDLSVSPLLMEFNQKPRTKTNFEFSVSANETGHVNIYLYNMSQKASGHMEFTEIDHKASNSATSWVSLEKNNYKVKKSEAVAVKGTISVPSKAKGTHLVAVIVEEDKSKKKADGVSLNVRYAVVLAIHVSSKRKPRHTAKAEDIEVIAKNGHLYLQTQLLNQSEYEFQAKSTAQIRDDKGKLVEKISLKSQSAWERKDDFSRIFPQGNVILFGEIRNIKSPGNYQVMLRNKLGHQNLPLMRKEISVTSDLLSFQDKKVVEGGVVVSPEPITIDIRSNQESYTYFELNNNTDSALLISFPTKDGNSLQEGITSFEFFPSTFKLKPYLSKRILLRQKHNSITPGTSIIYKATYKNLNNNSMSTISILTTIKEDSTKGEKVD